MNRQCGTGIPERRESNEATCKTALAYGLEKISKPADQGRQIQAKLGGLSEWWRQSTDSKVARMNRVGYQIPG